MDCMLQLYRAKLLPKTMTEVRFITDGFVGSPGEILLSSIFDEYLVNKNSVGACLDT